MFDTWGMPGSAAAVDGLPAGLLERLGVRALTGTGEQLLVVSPGLAGVFPGGGLRRGVTVTVTGSSLLVLALVAEVSKARGWCAEVGSPLLGSAAAAEVGVVLERFVRVPAPGVLWPDVVASFLEAFDVVIVHPPAGARAADMRRLSARARERRAVLVVTGGWDGAMVGLSVVGQRWQGLGDGHGYLRAREVDVAVVGRGAAARPRVVTLWLPGVGGVVAAARENAA